MHHFFNQLLNFVVLSDLIVYSLHLRDSLIFFFGQLNTIQRTEMYCFHVIFSENVAHKIDFDGKKFDLRSKKVCLAGFLCSTMFEFFVFNVLCCGSLCSSFSAQTIPFLFYFFLYYFLSLCSSVSLCLFNVCPFFLSALFYVVIMVVVVVILCCLFFSSL